MALTLTKGSVPLYMQVRDWIVERITRGEWAPGNLIPSEIQLATALNVSQGTARKAITDLVENNVLVRRQGKGTFVANHDDNRALFHFFHVVNDSGTKILPESKTLSCRKRRSLRREALKLGLPGGSQVVHIERVRYLDSQPVILETVILPTELFGDLGNPRACELPNMLYELYETRFNITIHRAEEKLRAVSASEHEASLLGVTPAAPLLEIERIALTLSGMPVELRISRCNTAGHYYQNTVL